MERTNLVSYVQADNHAIAREANSNSRILEHRNVIEAAAPKNCDIGFRVVAVTLSQAVAPLPIARAQQSSKTTGRCPRLTRLVIQPLLS